ncbi:DUF5666 domain-containing protein [Rhodococcus sp. NPDC004095]
MSNPDDQRTPDGTEALPVDPDPTSEWAQRPVPATPDQPTEQIGFTADPHQAYGGAAGESPTQAYPTQAYPTEVHPTQAYPTQVHPTQAHPTQAYPTPGYPAQAASNPTQAYPTYDAYQGQPPNATQAYPTYDAYQGQPPNATQAYPTYDGYQGQPPIPPQSFPAPDGAGGPDDEKKGPGKGVVIAAVAVAGLLLAAVVGLGAMLLSSGGDTADTASAPTTTRTQPPVTPRPTTPPRTTEPEIEPPDLSRIPGGVGEAIGAAGAAVGSVKSNAGGTLILDGIGGSQVTVTTDASTRVIALGASSVADLKVGETVLVQGDRGADGTVAARVIISTSIPDLGDFGGN